MKSYLTQGWLVLVLALGFGAALAGIQSALGPKIAANQKAETYGQIPSLVLGAEASDLTAKIDGQTIDLVDAGGKTVRTLTVSERQFGPEGDTYKVYEVAEAGENDGVTIVGWVVPGEGLGYGDKIQALIGLNGDATTITGVYVLSQKETPGLGSKIASDWNRQYIGKPTAPPLTVVKTTPTDDTEIRAITGATISSNALTSIVNDTVGTFRKDLPVDKDRPVDEGGN